MGGRASNPWMSMAEVAAAAALGGACAFALASLLLAQGIVSTVPAASALTCGLVFLLAYAALARDASGAPHHLDFALEPIPTFEAQPMGELLLTDADRLIEVYPEDSRGADGGELLLDDVLAVLRPDARVVRLFDVNALPTPGQLQASIDRHLGSSGSRSAPPDASEALHQALAELRRSLR
jgi:hypothetical protein